MRSSVWNVSYNWKSGIDLHLLFYFDMYIISLLLLPSTYVNNRVDRETGGNEEDIVCLDLLDFYRQTKKKQLFL